ncbi:NADH dehydrogenase [Alphaproteobacteria bacterium]|nr:NADH dehydrogenase [Alphaproteobacteria bacterium]
MEQQTADKVIAAARKWAAKRGSLIMALHEVQGMLGYVPWEASEIIAREMGVPLARIYEVLSFYNYFKLEMPGKVVVSICDGTACHIKGGEDLSAAFEKVLGIRRGTTTPDGNFHLQIVRCLGCCGLAPVVVVNGKTYGKVHAADAAKIVEEWQKKVAVNG